MKVGLITILDNINFGTILQAYALANKIESFGHKVCFINYWRPNSSIRCQIRGILNDKKRSLVRRVVYAVSALFLVPFIKLRLRSFLTSRFRFTRKYRSIESLRKHPPQADIYMTGSDQVWNSRFNKETTSVTSSGGKLSIPMDAGFGAFFRYSGFGSNFIVDSRRLEKDYSISK